MLLTPPRGADCPAGETSYTHVGTLVAKRCFYIKFVAHPRLPVPPQIVCRKERGVLAYGLHVYQNFVVTGHAKGLGPRSPTGDAQTKVFRGHGFFADILYRLGGI